KQPASDCLMCNRDRRRNILETKREWADRLAGGLPTEPDSNGESQRILSIFSVRWISIFDRRRRYLVRYRKDGPRLESRQRRGHRELVIDLTFLRGNTGSALAEPWKGVS